MLRNSELDLLNVKTLLHIYIILLYNTNVYCDNFPPAGGWETGNGTDLRKSSWTLTGCDIYIMYR